MADADLKPDGSATRDDERSTPPPTDAKGWKQLIAQAEKDAEPWRQRCKRIRDRYRYEQAKQTRRRRYQLLWANLETLRPAVYARTPKPIVENRWKNDDPVAHTAAELIERNIAFQFELMNYDRAFKLVRDDYLSFARGAARFRYEPIWKTAEIEDSDDGDEAEEGNIEGGVEHPEEDEYALKTENVRLEYVNRNDLILPAGRIWEEIPWVAFRSFLTRDQLIERFGKKKGKDVTLDSKGADNSNEYEDRTGKSAVDKATVYEIWDKTRRECVWICKSGPDIMDRGAPYLKLVDFFPMPRPAFGTMTTDTLEPVPDFVYYQDQSEEVDDLTARIAGLQDSLKLVGFYPLGPDGEGSPEVERAVKPGFENRMIGVKAWTIFQEAGRGGAPIIWLPVEQVQKVLSACVELRKQLIDDVHQITGVSDIMRADTDPEETATAQNKKSNWSAVRLKDRRDEMSRFCRDVTRMTGEIIASHFQIETMMACADMPLPSDRDMLIAGIQRLLAAQRQAIALPAPSAGMSPGIPLPGGPGAPPDPMPAPGPPMGNGQVVPFPGPAGGAPAPMAGLTPSPPGAPGSGIRPPQPGAPPLTSQPNGVGQPPPQPPAPGTAPQPAAPEAGPTQEQVLTLLRDNITRRFRLEIETDSTIEADNEKEREDRVQFIEATVQMITSLMPVVKEMPEIVPFAGTLIKFGANGFPVARDLMNEIDKFTDTLAAKMSAQGPPPPPPEIQVEQMKAQTAQFEAQAESRGDMLEMQATQTRAQAEAQKARMEVAAEMAEHQHNMQAMALDHQANIAQHQMAMQKAAVDQQSLSQRIQEAEAKRMAAQTAANVLPGGPPARQG